MTKVPVILVVGRNYEGIPTVRSRHHLDGQHDIFPVTPKDVIDPTSLPEAAVEAAYCAQRGISPEEFSVLWKMANEDAPMRGMEFFESVNEVKDGLAAGLTALMEDE